MERSSSPASPNDQRKNGSSSFSDIRNEGDNNFILQGSDIRSNRDINFYLSSDKRKEIENWLSPLESETLFQSLRRTCIPTGEWLFDREEFQTWLSGDLRSSGELQYLHLYGGHGSGKTFLSTRIVDRLVKERQGADISKSDYRVFHLLLDPDTTAFQQQSVSHTRISDEKEILVGDLLKQLFRRLDGKCPNIRELFHRKTQQGSSLEWQEACQIWRNEIRKYRQVYLVIDGLDKYSAPTARALLNEMCVRHPKNLNVLFTSRDSDFGFVRGKSRCANSGCGGRSGDLSISCPNCNPDGLEFCPTCIDSFGHCEHEFHELCRCSDPAPIYVSPPTEDIIRYIEAVCKNDADLDPDLETDIIDGTAQRAGDNYILARLWMEHFGRTETKNSVEKLFLEFPETIEAFYRGAISKIVEQDRQQDRELGLRVLFYVSQSHRTLTLDELRHVLAVKKDSNDIDEGDLYRSPKFRSIAAYLIAIDDIDDLQSEVQPFNDTVCDFLMSFDLRAEYDQIRDEDSPELDFGASCVWYLNCKPFKEPCASIRELENRILDYPFVAYAAQFWGDHINESLSQPGTTIRELQELVLQFLKDTSRLASCTQIAWFKKYVGHGGFDVRQGLTGLHLCAWFGLDSIISTLISSDDIAVDVRDKTYGQTPLMYACRRGQIDVVQKLLELNANVNAVSSQGRTPLFEAIDPTLYTLSTAGGVVLPAEEDDEIQETVLQALLERPELDINVTDVRYFRRTPLMLAVQLGRPAMVQSLLAHDDIDINQRDIYGGTALTISAFRGSEAITDILLHDPRVDVNVYEDITNYSALTHACENGNPALVKLLLDRGADPNHKAGYDDDTAIMRAAALGESGAVAALLDYQGSGHIIQLECLNNKGEGLLHVLAGAKSATDEHVEILELLKSCKLDPNAKDNFGMTPLHHACRTGNCAILSMLITDLKASDSTEDHLGRTPYTVACCYDQIDAQNILIGAADSRGELPLSITGPLPIWALVKQSAIDAIKKAGLANEARKDFDVELGTDNTSVHWAVRASNPDILQFLLTDACQKPGIGNSLGHTPLHDAAFLGDEDSIQILLKHGAHVDEKDLRGFTPLARALTARQFSAAVTLFENGADLDLIQYVREIKTQTMFFTAIADGRFDAVKKLLENGADLLGRTPDDQSAIQLAMEKAEDGQIFKLLDSTKSFSYSLSIADSSKSSWSDKRRASHSAALEAMKDTSWPSASLWQAFKGINLYTPWSQSSEPQNGDPTSGADTMVTYYTLL